MGSGGQICEVFVLGKLVYFKWMVDDAEVLKENLSNEQIGELFIAVMDYLRDGTVYEVSKDLRLIYADYKKRVDRSRITYEETCAKRAESGKKGGTAKAKNAARSAVADLEQAKKFKPPTRKQFKDAVENFSDDGELYTASNYEIDCLYDHLVESRWMIDGFSIQNRADWESVIIARFYKPDSVARCYYWEAFCYVFSAYKGLRDDSGKTRAEEVVNDWADDADNNRKIWVIDGHIYPESEWKSSLDAYIISWKREKGTTLANASTC